MGGANGRCEWVHAVEHAQLARERRLDHRRERPARVAVLVEQTALQTREI